MTFCWAKWCACIMADKLASKARASVSKSARSRSSLAKAGSMDASTAWLSNCVAAAMAAAVAPNGCCGCCCPIISGDDNGEFWVGSLLAVGCKYAPLPVRLDGAIGIVNGPVGASSNECPASRAPLVSLGAIRCNLLWSIGAKKPAISLLPFGKKYLGEWCMTESFDITIPPPLGVPKWPSRAAGVFCCRAQKNCSCTRRIAGNPGARSCLLAANFLYLARADKGSPWCCCSASSTRDNARKAITSCLTKGCDASCAESERWLGSFSQQHFTKSNISGLQWSGSAKVGAGLVGINEMARMGFKLACGGAPSAISIAVIPKLHTSARPS